MINKNRSGVVLLITLFFIMIISLLIVKNLDDSNDFMNEVSQDTTLTQVQITAKNIESEVLKLTTKYKDHIDEVLEIASIGLPLNYGDISLTIELTEYEVKPCKLKNINSNECNELMVNLVSPYTFKEQFQDHNVTTKEQLSFIVDKYKNIVQDSEIENIEDAFEYLPLKPQDRYLKCVYTIDLQDKLVNGEFIFSVNSSKVLYHSLK